MKKVIALIIAVAIVASMGVLSVLAADNHISADEIFGASAEKTDIGRGGTWGSVGGNTTVPTEPAETDMGDTRINSLLM